MENFTLKVIEVRRETEDTVTLCFKLLGLKKNQIFCRSIFNALV